jgi:hypothetical protein
MIIRKNNQEYSGSLVEISNSGELVLLLDNGRKKKFRIEHTVVKDHNE